MKIQPVGSGLEYSLRHPFIGAGRWYVRNSKTKTLKPFVAGLASIGVLGNRGMFGAPYVGTTRTRNGQLFRVDTTDLVQHFLHLFGEWEPNLQAWLRGRLRTGDTFTDIGANVGTVAVPAAGLVGPSGRVIAIDASPNTCKILRKNIEMNCLANIRVIESAVSDHDEKIEFFIESKQNLGGTSAFRAQTFADSFTVTARSLPDLLSADEFTSTRVFKIDVEGAEVEVLRGIIAQREAMHPDVEIVVEVAPGRIGVRGHTINDLLEPMRAAGFHAYVLPNTYQQSAYPALVDNPLPPVRLNWDVTESADLVFSQIDAERLDPLH